MAGRGEADPTEDEEKDDPIVTEYDVFVTESSVQRLLFQYPDREPRNAGTYTASYRQRPEQLRLKPKTGLVEVDIPVNTYENYDERRGLHYGEVMRKSRLVKGGGSYGISGGFSEGPLAAVKVEGIENGFAGQGSLDEYDTDDDIPLAVQTLGGRIIPPKDGDPVYMLAAFHNDEVHLSHIDGVVQLRPQLHHLDAAQDATRNMSRAQQQAEDAARQGEARAVEMRVKSVEGEEINMKRKAELLNAIQGEKWQKFDFKDEENPESEGMYETQILAQNVDHPPKLDSTMNNGEYLHGFSAPRLDPTRPEKKMMTKFRSMDSEYETGDDTDVIEVVENPRLVKVKSKDKEKAKRKPRTKKSQNTAAEPEGAVDDVEMEQE